MERWFDDFWGWHSEAWSHNWRWRPKLIQVEYAALRVCAEQVFDWADSETTEIAFILDGQIQTARYR